VIDELRQVAHSSDFVNSLRQSAMLAQHVGRLPDPADVAAELTSIAEEGTLPAIVAIESLAALPHPAADRSLVALLLSHDQLVRRHASWRLADRLPTRRAYGPLLEQLAIGGIDTMHAHRTLRGWAESDAQTIVELVVATLESEADPLARARLVDLLGVIVGHGSSDALIRLATDPFEVVSARVSAVGALTERADDTIDSVLHHLASRDDETAAHAALALSDRTTPDPPTDRAHAGGLRIAQLVLAGGLDGQLSLGGRGDTGGVASLLVSLGEALAHRADVEHVVTIGLGSIADALVGPVESNGLPLSYGTIMLGDSVRGATTPDEFWEHLPAIERGIRRALQVAGPIDVLHLRMADGGTLAGAEVARASGIPTCFSVAPDPHNVIESLQCRGELDAESFVELATNTHVWFRARLVERLAHSADRLALFPRRQPLQFLDAIGVSADENRRRVAEVAEGIDIRMLDRASTVMDRPPDNARCRDDVLDRLAECIPPSRRHLPLVVSVGRLHPVKGMDRVVAAWVSNSVLYDRSNLVIVGGDLDDPSATERSVLDAIDRVVPADDPRRAGLVLLGGRPRADIARLLISTVTGTDGGWSSGGVYVDGALKEEFGLAVLEALAAGLVVVAPSTGGPSTYVEQGDTGILVDPGGDLAVAIRDAFGLVGRPGRASSAREMVEQRYSIDTMAAQLSELYRPAEVRV
jgi:glycosyltransferase involved in cell wall biosynthesis